MCQPVEIFIHPFCFICNILGHTDIGLAFSQMLIGKMQYNWRDYTSNVHFVMICTDSVNWNGKFFCGKK